MSQHTKGPWEADSGEIYGVDNKLICRLAIECNPYEVLTDEDRANARLIAAAPDMLEALAYVVNWHREHDSGEGKLFGRDYVTACISALRKADPEWRTGSNGLRGI